MLIGNPARAAVLALFLILQSFGYMLLLATFILTSIIYVGLSDDANMTTLEFAALVFLTLVFLLVFLAGVSGVMNRNKIMMALYLVPAMIITSINVVLFLSPDNLADALVVKFDKRTSDLMKSEEGRRIVEQAFKCKYYDVRVPISKEVFKGVSCKISTGNLWVGLVQFFRWMFGISGFLNFSSIVVALLLSF